jgi:hypothetical protein
MSASSSTTTLPRRNGSSSAGRFASSIASWRSGRRSMLRRNRITEGRQFRFSRGLCCTSSRPAACSTRAGRRGDRIANSRGLAASDFHGASIMPFRLDQFTTDGLLVATPLRASAEGPKGLRPFGNPAKKNQEEEV